MKKTIILLITLLTVNIVFGQRERGDFKRMKHRPFQVSLVHPIGTNGFYSSQFVNHLSFNMIAGYNGALQGMEFGGVINGIKYNASGLQFAGFGNLVGRSVNGAQFAGFMNIVGKDVRAIQAAGFANIVGENSRGIQLAGFTNIVGGNTKGIQLAGFMNISRQMSGFQASGFLNVAGTLKGIQLGVFNFADSVKGGIPIGLFSFVRKNGYRKIEIGTNETFRGTAMIKMGVPQFYNIIAIGYRPGGNSMTWATGYGIGSQVMKKGPLSANIDAVAYHVNEGKWWTDELNMLNRVSFDVAFNFGKNLAIHGGLALNIIVSEYENGQTNIANNRVLYEYFNDHTSVIIYPGFQAGIRL